MAGMCGRFTLRTPADEVARAFALEAPCTLVPRYNIAPSQEVAVVRRLPGRPRPSLATMRWGLVSAWARRPGRGAEWINVRSETAFERPPFREAARARRCLIPADGFFEWARDGRRKQPYLVRLRSGAVFGMAGLWERSRAPDGTPVETCAILTTDANEAVRKIHDRMPAILAPADHAAWLDPAERDPERLGPLLRPYPAAEMIAVAVSPRVNDPRNDDPQCLERAAVQGDLGFG
jgi:putative SOS response-associated peptidase YedK